MCRIVVVSIGGAVTIASRFVTCESVSVVTRIASSTSWRASVSESTGTLVSSSGSSRSTKYR